MQQQKLRQRRESIISMKFIDIFESNWKPKQDGGKIRIENEPNGSRNQMQFFVVFKIDTFH